VKLENALVVLSLAVAACGGAAAAPAEAPSAIAAPGASSMTAAAALKAPGDAKVGDKTVCPVTKEEFTVSESSPKAEVNGKTYYFCCGGCSGKFKADPQKFLGANKT
jgi:YHS domain-containing protein